MPCHFMCTILHPSVCVWQESDAWKRRGQTRAAKGACHEALKDYNRAMQLQPGDADSYYQRALCYNQMKNYKLALADLKRHNEMGGEQTGRLWNYIGMCESQLGNVSVALQAYGKSIAMDSSVVEAHINYAQMLKEAGRWRESDVAFDSLFKAHPKAFPGHYYRGLLHYGQGHSLEALGSMRRFLGVAEGCSREEMGAAGVGEKEVVTALVTSALCLQALGAYSDAIEYFNKVLTREPAHVCRVQKQILMFYYKRLDRPTSSFNIDNVFDPAWKEMWCKALPCHESIVPDDADEEKASALPPGFETNAMTSKILRISRELSPWVQLSSPGFMPHRRQQRAFGLSVLQMAHALVRNCESIRDSDRPMTMSNTGSSQRHTAFSHTRSSSLSCAQLVGADGQTANDKHGFAYRDMCDIAVKWRQLAEPNDAVWWIDRLPSKSFEEGFGLQTPMVNGQLKCIRYYSYFDMGFGLLKQLVDGGYYDASSTLRQLSEMQRSSIAAASSLEEVHGAIGEDFYVVCPCQSSLDQSTIIEGTRLTVLAKPPDGYDFSIRCPGLPAKWVLMDAELHACFDEIVSDLLLMQAGKLSEEKLLSDALKFFYYWTNFSPLSRGSAQTGYAVLMAVMLAGGRRINSPVPHGIQFDWEAIFTPEFPMFRSKIAPMITTEIDCISFDSIDFEEGVPSLLSMLHLLNAD
jgi:tetratricopeptide (TPR) repeat protein